MRDFSGKVAAVTGAGSGIGRALAVELAGRGCGLSLCDLQGASLEATAAAAEKLGVKVTQKVVDVAERGAVHAWAEETVAQHGRANLIFNNAGVALSATVAGMEYEDLEWILGINLWGVIHGTKAFLPHLIASGDGHVVNVSSVFGLAGIPTQSGYNIAKFGVRGFTDSLRQELEMMNCGVSATCVHPGGIKTGIARNARMHASVTAVGLEARQDKGEFEKAVFTTPERAAKIILRAVQRNRRRVLVGPDAYMFDFVTRLFPAHYQGLAPLLSRWAKKRQAAPGIEGA